MKVEPKFYVVIFKNNAKQFNEDSLFKRFIVDAAKDEQSASIRQISLRLQQWSNNIQI